MILFGVFEDDGETGYLYFYEPGGREVFQHLHIYDRSPKLPIQEQDVRVVWSNVSAMLNRSKFFRSEELQSGTFGGVKVSSQSTRFLGKCGDVTSVRSIKK